MRGTTATGAMRPRKKTTMTSLIRSEVDYRFAAASPHPWDLNPITGDPVLTNLEEAKRTARRARLAQEFFYEYRPTGVPDLPITDAEIERLWKIGDDLALAVAIYARSLQANGWDFKRHPGFEEFVGGLLCLPQSVCVPFKYPEDLVGRFRAYPLHGLGSTGWWYPPDR
jgi:hypothetical protein